MMTPPPPLLPQYWPPLVCHVFSLLVELGCCLSCVWLCCTFFSDIYTQVSGSLSSSGSCFLQYINQSLKVWDVESIPVLRLLNSSVKRSATKHWHHLNLLPVIVGQLQGFTDLNWLHRHYVLIIFYTVYWIKILQFDWVASKSRRIHVRRGL